MIFHFMLCDGISYCDDSHIGLNNQCIILFYGSLHCIQMTLSIEIPMLSIQIIMMTITIIITRRITHTNIPYLLP